MAEPARRRRRHLIDTSEEVSPFYIPLSGAGHGQGVRTLKHSDTFVVLDNFGDAQAQGPSAEGLFHEDTRYLSRLVMLVDGERPLLLSSTVTRDNTVLAIELTNPDFYDGDRLVLARDKIHLRRSKVLCAGGCFEIVEIRSFADHAVAFTLSYLFAADFADMFEVRGTQRAARGETQPEETGPASVTLGYDGLDGVRRRTHLAFDPRPQSLHRREARFTVRLPPGGSTRVALSLRCERDGEIAAAGQSFEDRSAAAVAEMAARREDATSVRTSNTAFDSWIGRSRADLDMLVTDTPCGPYPYAGIPWFNTAFGRDGIIAALETLWLQPSLARGVLAFLAATQATELSAVMDAEPGKILHETRKGEMAMLGEVPFARYYGSVDSTPLFLVLAAAYHERTGDTVFIRGIWPHIEAALGWMEEYGDRDGDGFLEYGRRSETGLSNQGWKDSGDSIFHADGRLAEAPIALVEVQAYAYAAWRGTARLAAALGDRARHDALEERATELQRRFSEAFWCEELGTFALALDRDKQPCRVRSSNAGHALFAGIASPAQAARVAATLMEPDQFSEWGIRTIASSEARYNPISYHNGSIWPHDNELIALGFSRYGLREPLLRLLTGFHDAAAAIEFNRLPELFCGFPRRRGEGPTPYPVACAPQAWSSACAFALLGAALGISFHPDSRQIRFTRPVLPAFLEEVRLEHLRMGAVSVDLLFRRHMRDTSLNVLRKEGDAEIVLISG